MKKRVLYHLSFDLEQRISLLQGIPPVVASQCRFHLHTFQALQLTRERGPLLGGSSLTRRLILCIEDTLLRIGLVPVMPSSGMNVVSQGAAHTYGLCLRTPGTREIDLSFESLRCGKLAVVEEVTKTLSLIG